MNFSPISSARNKSHEPYGSCNINSSRAKTMENLAKELDEKKRYLDSSQSVLFRCKETILSLTNENKHLRNQLRSEKDKTIISHAESKIVINSEQQQMSVLRDSLTTEKEKNKKLMEALELKENDNFTFKNRIDEFREVLLLRNQEINELRREKEQSNKNKKGFWSSLSLNSSNEKDDNNNNNNSDVNDLENQLSFSYDTIVPDWNTNNIFPELYNSEDEMKVENNNNNNNNKQYSSLTAELSATNELLSLSQELAMLRRDLSTRDDCIRSLQRELHDHHKTSTTTTTAATTTTTTSLTMELEELRKRLRHRDKEVEQLKRAADKNSDRAQTIIDRLGRGYNYNNNNNNNKNQEISRLQKEVTSLRATIRLLDPSAVYNNNNNNSNNKIINSKNNNNKREDEEEFVNIFVNKLRLMREIESFSSQLLLLSSESDNNNNNNNTSEFLDQLNGLDYRDKEVLRDCLMRLSWQMETIFNNNNNNNKSLNDLLKSIDCRMIVTEKQRYLIVRQK